MAQFFIFKFSLFYSICSRIAHSALYKTSKDKPRMVKDKDYRNERQRICQRKTQICEHYGFFQAAMNLPRGREEEIILPQNAVST